VALLGRFELTCGGVRVQVPMSAQRVLAFVALHEHSVLRAHVAGSLWLETSEARAHANLRSALWRLHRCGGRLVDATCNGLRLGAEVHVDLREAEAVARRIISDADPSSHVSPEVLVLAGDVLPDWYDEWVLLERERFRQLRLRALETLSDRLVEAGRLAEALDAAQAAVGAEPLRESAHRALVRVHLVEGNAGEAVRQYRLFRHLLGEQLGLEPSERMEELMRSIAAAGSSR
jgi:DNA-binding SARP family transcriptional activator